MKHERSYYANINNGKSEHNDCSVRAVALATCSDYDTVHALFKKHGRRDKHTTKTFISAEVIEEMFPGTDHVYFKRDSRPTVNNFAARFSEGHYVVVVSKHMFAICDGIIHDWTPGVRRRVISYWRVA